MIVINTKNYKTGKQLVNLAKLVRSSGLKAIMAVPATDISNVSKLGVKVYAQHVDLTNDKSTGFISARDAKKAGASGTLLNHAEHRLSFAVLKKSVMECKKQGLKTVICAAGLKEARRFAGLRPYAIAFEDPKLIGSGKSITTYEPVEVLKFVDFLKSKRIKSICGAGISSVGDVRAAFELGCSGVLVASAIAASKNPRGFLKALKAECL